MTPQVSAHLNTINVCYLKLKKNLRNWFKEKGSNKRQIIQKKLKKKKKEWKATQNLIQKCAQNFCWLMRGVSIDMCSIEFQLKSSQKLNKTKALLCKNAKLPIVQNASFKWKFA